MKNLVNGSNFARYSDFVFSEIVSKEEFDSLKEKITIKRLTIFIMNQ